MAATLDGPLDATSGLAQLVFTGIGRPGDTIWITRGGAGIGSSGLVAADGTFAISMSATLAGGDLMQAHAGAICCAGPSNNTVTVLASVASPDAPLSATVSAGATIITVSGTPGDTVHIVVPGSSPPQDLGSAVVPANGQVGVVLSQPLAPGQIFVIVDNGSSSGPIATSGSSVPPPVLGVGTILEGSSVITGTGVAGATIQAVDSQGHVLGTTTVDAQGNFSLTVSGATAGHPVSIIQNGVKGGSPLPAFTLNPEKAFTSVNVFNPDKGGSLDIGFRPDLDGSVTVKVYNMAGNLIRPVFEASVKAGLQYQATWDGKNGTGDSVASGVYFVSVRGAGIKTIRKVIVIK